LEDDAVVALCWRQAGDVAPGQLDAPGALCLQPGDDAQQRGLAAARRAEEADELTLGDLEMDVAKRCEAAKVLADAGQLQVTGAAVRAARGLCGQGLRREWGGHFFGSLLAL